MRVNVRCLLLRPAALLSVALVAGCPVRPHAPAAAAPTSPGPAAHLGTPFEIAAAESLLTIRVYKGGALAAAGHNHLVASHALGGTIYVPADVLRTSFEVRVPVDSLTVDEAALRTAEHSSDFPPDVPDSAREGTRRNMLGEALLDGARFPQIVLRALALAPLQPPAPGGAIAHVQASVRGEAHEFSVPVRYERSGGTVTVTGQTTLRQTDLGLKPFSAMLGALQVQDEMHLRFTLVAHAPGAAPR